MLSDHLDQCSVGTALLEGKRLHNLIELCLAQAFEATHVEGLHQAGGVAGKGGLGQESAMGL